MNTQHPADNVSPVIVTSLHDHNVTLVRIDLATPFGVMTGTGSAKRHPTDKARNDIGETLAYARALRSITNRLERRARGLVRDADHNAAQRPVIAAARAAREAAAVVAAKNDHPAVVKAAKVKDATKKARKADLKLVKAVGKGARTNKVTTD